MKLILVVFVAVLCGLFVSSEAAIARARFFNPSKCLNICYQKKGKKKKQKTKHIKI